MDMKIMSNIVKLSASLIILIVLVPLDVASVETNLSFEIKAGCTNVMFDESWLSPSQKNSHKMSQDIEKFEKDYLSLLKHYGTSRGLYAIGSYSSDLENTENRYIYGLEWRMFNEGYHQSHREERKKALQTRLEFLQLKRDSYLRELDEELYRISTLKMRLTCLKAKKKTILLDKIISRRKAALEEGFAISMEMANLERQYIIAKENRLVCEDLEPLLMDKETWWIANHIETLKLRPFSKLLDEAQRESTDLKIQTNFIARSETFPNWLDDLDVRLYAVDKNEFYDRDRQEIGVRVAIPLYLNKNRRKIVELQKEIYLQQKRDITERLSQRLRRLINLYNFQIFKLKSYLIELKLLFEQENTALTKEEYAIQKLETEPKRERELLELKILDKRYQILSTRLEVLSWAVRIQYLTHANHLSGVFEQTALSCLVH